LVYVSTGLVKPHQCGLQKVVPKHIGGIYTADLKTVLWV